MYGLVIGKHINDITLNPLEYIVDDNGNYMEFENKENAVKFLKEHGFTDDDMWWLRFQWHTICLQCGEEVFVNEDDVSIDDLVICTECPECHGSFDVK